jgi:hypothetical protein
MTVEGVMKMLHLTKKPSFNNKKYVSRQSHPLTWKSEVKLVNILSVTFSNYLAVIDYHVTLLILTVSLSSFILLWKPVSMYGMLAIIIINYHS